MKTHKKPFRPVNASMVTNARDLARIRAKENARAQREAHEAALHVIDVCDAIMSSPPPAAAIPSYGPRTASHPMATPTPPPVLHAVARNATNYLAFIGALTAFVAGVALGKAL